MSGSSFEDLFWIGLFLAAVYIFGRIPRIFGFSPIVGEVAAGVIFGPPVLNIVPLYRVFGVPEGSPVNVTGTAQHRLLSGAEEGQGTIIWVMLGQLGVTLLIVESGLHAEFSTLRRVGGSAAGVAIMGTLIPLAGGVAFASLLGFPAFPDGAAIGAILAPTSVGIALKLLQEAKQLNSQFGQTIMTAAFIDDVLSLVALAVLLQFGSGDISVEGVAAPFLFSALFIGVAFYIAYKPAPFVINKLLDFVNERFPHNKSHGPSDEVHLTLMLLVVLLYTFIGSLVGSHLLGAFVSGVTFCTVPRSMLVWGKQLKRIEAWLIRLFFAATVGFSIPIQSMLTLESFWKGLVITIVPCIGGKVLSGVFQGERRWVIGWSMVGRGEFSFLVAETSRTTLFQGADDGVTYLLSKDAYGVVVWALLLATIITPFAFRCVLNQQQRADEDSAQSKKDDKVLEKNANIVGKWKVIVRAVHGFTGLSDVLSAIRNLNYTVTSVEVQSDGVFDQEAFLIVPTEDQLPIKKPSTLAHRGNRGSLGSFGILSKASKSSLVGEERFKDPFYHEDPEYTKEKIKNALLDAIDDRTGSVMIDIEPCAVDEKHAHKSFSRPALHQLGPMLDVGIHERLREKSVHGGGKFGADVMGESGVFHTTITHNDNDETFDRLYQHAHELATSAGNRDSGSTVHSMNTPDPEDPKARMNDDDL